MAPAAGQAQVVRGRLLETGSRQPVMLGTVALLDSTLAVVDETFTNEKGAFVLDAPKPGSYYVLAGRLGYTPAVDGILELGEGGEISVDFYLRAQPLLLDSLKVEVERQRIVRSLENAGFYQRQKEGFGHFVTPEDIEKRQPLTPRDLLRSVPGVWVVENGYLGQEILMSNSRGGRCAPRLFVDGAQVTSFGGRGFRLEDVVGMQDISAVEVYRGGPSVPLQWGGTQDSCGLLLVWTHAGR